MPDIVDKLQVHRDEKQFGDARSKVGSSEGFGKGISTPNKMVKIDDLTKSNVGDSTQTADLKNYVTLVGYDDGGLFKETTPNIGGLLRSSSMVTIRDPHIRIRRDEKYPDYRKKLINGDKINEINIVELDNINGVWKIVVKYSIKDVYFSSVDLSRDDNDEVVIFYRPRIIQVTHTPYDKDGKAKGNTSTTFNAETGQLQ